jgi:hypothetical protein
VVTLVFLYRLPFGKEIKRKEWVDRKSALLYVPCRVHFLAKFNPLASIS